MKFLFLAALAGAFCSSSCFSSDYGPPAGGYDPRFGCAQFSSCATCTPVLGCGWCQAGSKGLCAPDPDSCSRVASFSWTWDLAFCPAELDAGLAASADAARESATGDAATDATGDRASGAEQ
ncbi:MAG TPA: hypothetical protein VGK52_14095 [Polyangia bacterium]|jgi:hypothetical protein